MRRNSGVYNRITALLLAALLLFALTACGSAESPDAAETVLASVVETDLVTVQNNGQQVEIGGDAVFSMLVKENYKVTAADYSGEYTLTQNKNMALLTLKDVRYPVRVTVTAANEVWAITYEPNGAPQEAQIVYYEKTVHARPNTSNGRDLFRWDGHTLTGWNTEPDGTGTHIGLGSRVTVRDGSITLYAEWSEWTEASAFTWEERDGGAVITGCSAGTETLTVPGTLGGLPVTSIACGAFCNLPCRFIILPDSLKTVENGAVQRCAVEEVTFFDNIESIFNAAFIDCGSWKTVHINAYEAPFGTCHYKESCYADKVDLLILAQGTPKMVFYAGCSVWYNLDVDQVKQTYGDRYAVIDMGLNGTASSELQLQILSAYLEAGDVLVHTPELPSTCQMMTETDLTGSDGVIWSGLEYNYDLVSLLDAQSLGDLLGSFTDYLNGKYAETTYESFFEDTDGKRYFGENGEIPFSRNAQVTDELADEVNLSPESIDETGMQRLGEWYSSFAEKGISVYVSYAALNVDALTSAEKNTLEETELKFRRAVEAMPGAVLISDLVDYEYREADFYDTNYHLLTNEAVRCTARWLADLAKYL